MRLLVINWQDRLNPSAGGAELHLHELFSRLVARGHEVVLLVSGWRGGAERDEVDGMEVHRVGTRHTFPLVAPSYYGRELRARGFDLVVEDLNKVPLWTPRWVESPLVLLVHHLFGTTAFSTASLPVATTTWLSERPLARAYRDAPVLAVSPSTADDLVERGFRREQISVVYNGVDTGFYHRDPRVARTAEPTLVYLGRLQRYKRVDLIVRALDVMVRMGAMARLRIAGRGPDEGRLRRLVERLRLSSRVEFLGYVDEERKRELLRTSWIHVLTSPKEGWGLTVLEAAACGTPTVASSSPGLRDSVVNRRTGLLVPHGDWVDLGGRLAELVGDRERLEWMGEEARRRAETFTWERSAGEAELHLASAAGERVLQPEPSLAQAV